MGSLEDKERGKCRKGSKGETESEGLTRVWRGKRSLKKASPERKKGWREKKKKKERKGQVIKKEGLGQKEAETTLCR